MKKQTPSTCQPASPRGSHRHPSRHIAGALIAGALTLAAPGLYAGKGGGKGNPGGGDPPPVDAIYKAIPIPRPSWGDSYQVRNLNNIVNEEDLVVVGTVRERSKGTNPYRQGFLCKEGAHRALAPLPGDDTTFPIDLSDDGRIVVGSSRLRGEPNSEDTLAAWVDPGDDNYRPVDLSAILMEAAAALLPDWNFTAIRGHGTHYGSTVSCILSPDARFMLAEAKLPANDWYPIGPDGEGWSWTVYIVVEWEWPDFHDPTVVDLEPSVANLWVLADRSLPDSPDTDPIGYILYGNALEQGFRDLDTATSPNVLRVAGGVDFYSVDEPWGLPGLNPAAMWELDLETGIASLTILSNAPESAGGPAWADAVNAFGEMAGAGEAEPGRYHDLFWSASGEPSVVQPLPGTSRAYSHAVTYDGAVVGDSSYVIAFIWTPAGGTVDLNSLVGGNLGLQTARSTNNTGQITAAGANGWYVLTPLPVE